jgi:hypothetical protein
VIIPVRDILLLLLWLHKNHRCTTRIGIQRCVPHGDAQRGIFNIGNIISSGVRKNFPLPFRKTVQKLTGENVFQNFCVYIVQSDHAST